MSKFNRILSIILVVLCLFGTLNIISFAATGKTVIKEIIDKYFIDDVEVSKTEYESILEESTADPEIEYEQVVVEHKYYTESKTTNYVYKINGAEVSEDEYNQYVSETSEISSTVSLTKNDLSVYNIGYLSDYLTFTEDEYGNISGAIVKSDKVVSATYKYTAGPCLSYCELQDGAYVYKEPSNLGYICCNLETMNFSMDSFTEEFTLCDENYMYSRTLSVGDTLFTFTKSESYTNITFKDIFESITLTISEEN